ncbi:MAG: ribose-5-phosphate isomerase RpiA [Pseudomonadota bacterium]
MGAEAGKRAAAAAALTHVEAGMRLGLGTGSTAKHFVELLGERVRGGLKVVGVPTSIETGRLAEKARIPLTTLDAAGRLDLTVDGADEIDPELNLIKGGGGALLIEKIVANASKRMIVIADASKEVARLGRFPLPVEVTPFAWETTRMVIEAALRSADVDGARTRLRMKRDAPFITDEGNMIVDLELGRIGDASALAVTLNAIPGVVDHGLFVGYADMAILGGEDGRCATLRPAGGA